MSWHSLNNLELSAIRKMMMFDVAEAAELIGKVSARTWQYWESGRSPVPPDVDSEMYAIFSQRNECIEGFFESDCNEVDKIPFFRDFDAFVSVFPGSNKVWWRVYQGVAAYLFSESEVELDDTVGLEKTSYLYQFFSRTREQDIEWQRQEDIINGFE